MRPEGTSHMRIVGRVLAPFGLVLLILAVESSVIMALNPSAAKAPRPEWSTVVIATGVGAIICIAVMAVLRRRGLVRFSWAVGQPVQMGVAACLGLALGVLTTLVGTALPGALPDLVAGYSFLQIAVLVVIGRSIYEELLFRGVLQGLLMPVLTRRWRFFGHDLTPGAVIGAIVFGLMHLMLLKMGGDLAPVLVVVIAGFLLGLLAGYYRDQTESMINPIVVHMCANLGGYLIGLLL